MSIAHTRAMIYAILDGSLKSAEFEREPFFGLDIPLRMHDVPSDVLNPRNAWKDRAAYDAQARKLAGLFADNFKQFEALASPGVRAAAIKPPA